MDINPTASGTAATAPPVSEPKEKAGVLSSDFETFLKMLTAQARFQDPLEPIESTEYAAQLAQFSMVEQQVLSNDLLKALSVGLGTGGIAQVAGWIGMDARSAAPARFEGQPIELTTEPIDGAEQAFLIVRGADGREVQRYQVSESARSLTWEGLDLGGSPLPADTYDFILEFRTAGEVIGTTTPETFTRVTEVRNSDGAAVLVLDSGAEVTASDVSALREPRAI
ncbi:flagellar hook capping FlgD N-terminal domain-containing protein [Sulfitobacter sp. D35]|uniref:flagellar hook capping FlgD N-terminal domain-containing protein n=1 Tax=Sulfitobacter sp. D35 TaxID=3083252 RepID=UPI00296F091A|nr:flagellar hook capping FlgD N-terminal domain-containing protein [Sulfitobacter sp. D35]MDW4498255.1 flagellar hook capping FlgD N-terminal domain-containing protein [Sulfitobacter sp. D35]